MRIRGFEIVDEKFRMHKNSDVILPNRGSECAAGYDIYAVVDFSLKPGEKAIIWTDIKAYMQDDEVLQIYVRSSIGIKKGLLLSNGTGIIDKDYYSNVSNDGNIGIGLVNTSEETVMINSGERIAQGIFLKYLVADNGNSNNQRIGGIGSTN